MAAASPAQRPPLAAVVDLERYPFHDRSHPACRRVLDEARAALRQRGCHSLPGVFRAEAIEACRAMVDGVAHRVHRSEDYGTIYGRPAAADVPAGHPLREPMRRRGGFICADYLDPASALWSFFDAPEITEFMEAAFEAAPLFQYADPVANLAVNAMWPGDEFSWHFDSNEMTVSILLSRAQAGGAFEYIPNIRTPTDERFDAVARALAGDRSGVETLELAPGDIQLFRGRYTLHRVTRVEGTLPRYVALPSWSTRPGQVGPVDRMRRSYGRVLPVHLERAGISPDELAQ